MRSSTIESLILFQNSPKVLEDFRLRVRKFSDRLKLRGRRRGGVIARPFHCHDATDTAVGSWNSRTVLADSLGPCGNRFLCLSQCQCFYAFRPCVRVCVWCCSADVYGHAMHALMDFYHRLRLGTSQNCLRSAVVKRSKVKETALQSSTICIDGCAVAL